jgi:hypothetical protein
VLVQEDNDAIRYEFKSGKEKGELAKEEAINDLR